MQEAMVGKGKVGLPSICYDECPGTNMSLDYRDENMVISVVVLTLALHLLTATSLVRSVEFPPSNGGLVELHDLSWPTKERGGL